MHIWGTYSDCMLFTTNSECIILHFITLLLLIHWNSACINVYSPCSFIWYQDRFNMYPYTLTLLLCNYYSFWGLCVTTHCSYALRPLWPTPLPGKSLWQVPGVRRRPVLLCTYNNLCTVIRIDNKQQQQSFSDIQSLLTLFFLPEA